MKQTFTEEEQIHRIWDIEDIKTLMNTRVFYVSGDKREKELKDLWVSQPENQKTASYGSNWGYYVGMDAIRTWYVDEHHAALEAQSKENNAPLNQGNLYAHPSTTGLVELAQDGKTAKGLWYSIGQETKANASGTADARWILGKMAVDFIREPDGWKIWHFIFALDVDCAPGTEYENYPVFEDWSVHSPDPVRKEFGTPTLEMLTHDVTFNWWDDYPPHAAKKL